MQGVRIADVDRNYINKFEHWIMYFPCVGFYSFVEDGLPN